MTMPFLVRYAYTRNGGCGYCGDHKVNSILVSVTCIFISIASIINSVNISVPVKSVMPLKTDRGPLNKNFVLLNFAYSRNARGITETIVSAEWRFSYSRNFSAEIVVSIERYSYFLEYVYFICTLSSTIVSPSAENKGPIAYLLKPTLA